MKKNILIIGLGNPGEKYENTRHNLGFMVLDKFSQETDSENNPFKLEEKFESLIKSYDHENRKIILAKPQTFMNNSGRAVKKIMDFYKIGLENLIVVHDDIDLPLGEIRSSNNSRSAGHRGVESIIETLGSQDFRRIRCGIRNEINENIPTEKFVLQKFSEEETDKLDSIIEKGVGVIDELISPK
jgi:peptidyl-tRNA hydrolase, PTH1 family